MNNVNTNNPLNNENYYSDPAFSRTGAEEKLKNLPAGSWLARPSSQGGLCFSYSTRDLEAMAYPPKVKFTHVLFDASNLQTRLENHHLFAENYVGPNEESLRNKYIALFQVVLQQADSSLAEAADSCLQTILQDRQVIVAHCREHPADCQLFYSKLEATAAKIQALSDLNKENTLLQHSLDTLTETLTKTAAIFREIERSKTIHGLCREEAKMQAPFVAPVYHNMPNDITFQLHVMMLQDFNTSTLEKLRSMYSETNQHILHQVIASAINRFAKPIYYALLLSKEEQQGIANYITFFHDNFSSSYSDGTARMYEHSPFLSMHGYNITTMKTAFSESVENLPNKSKLTNLCVPLILNPFDWNLLQALPALKKLTIESSWVGHITPTAKLLEGLRSDSIEKLTIQDLRGGGREVLVMESKTLALVLKNLPALKQLILPEDYSFQNEGEAFQLLAEHHVFCNLDKSQAN